jgi:hypothetical protein
MPHHTEQAAPTHRRYDDLIADAEAATGILPTIAECERLASELREAITPLADQVRRQQDRLPRDTAAWTVCERALLDAQGALCGGLGRGLRSAALHVATLGAAARRLVECIDRG